MHRHRRRAPGTKKRDIEELDNVTELKGLIQAHLKYRQLKAELKLMKLENKLNQQIRWLQTRRLDQLNEM
jgi:hypothetical protein